jgi:phosphate-selective porin OprO/OprP
VQSWSSALRLRWQDAPHLLRVALAVSLLATQPFYTANLRAQETNTLEIIKQLQKRIEELEQKVKSLENKTEPPPSEQKTKQRVEELDQQVKSLQQERQKDAAVAEAKAAKAPVISVGEQGFSMSSANGDFALQLKGVLQLDSRTFFADHGTVGNDGFLLRRARPVLQGTVFRDFDFLFVPDFGGTSGPQIFDAYLNYRPIPEIQLQAGKFKAPVGLEQLIADRDIWFNERGMPTALVPNRDIGFELHGDIADSVLSYAAGIFNGVGDGRNSNNADFEDDKAFAGRLFFQPFKKTDLAALKGVGFGLGGSYEDMQKTNTSGLPQTTGGSLAGFITEGQQQFFSYNPTNKGVVVAAGEHWRVAPQAYNFYGPFSLLGEYTISDQEVRRTGGSAATTRTLDNRAWQVAAGWVLTGEDAAYAGGVVPEHPFDLKNCGWGAWQLVGRYEELNVDRAAFPLFSDGNTSARTADEWSVGLNWYLNANIIVRTSFSRTTFRGGGGSSSANRPAENVLFTRLQLAF